MKKRNSMPPAHIAYVEDADDDGQVLSGAEPKYARSVAPSSPRKQQPNTSKARRDSRRTANVSSSTDSSDSTAHPTANKGKSKVRSKDERKSSNILVPSKQRPTVRSTKTTPAPLSRASDDPSAYYTVPHRAASSRPRAQTRPESYYGQSHSRPPPPRMPIAGPGITGPGFFQPPPPGMVQPSFPPPSWQAPFSGPMPPHLPPHLPPPPAPVDHHYAPRDLAMRFRRPSSSMGFRQASNPYEYEASPDRSMSRRQSISRKPPKDTKDHEDRKRMPPPPRPKSTRPERLDRLERMERPERQERPERIVLRAQAPPATHRKSVVFDDDDQDDESILYHDPHQKAHQNALRNAQNMLRRGSGVEYGSSPFKNARRQSFDAPESVFDFEDDEEDDEGDYYYEDELPPPPPRPRSRSRRRSSQVGIEDKIRDAARYQDHMVGGPSPALTAEALRKVKTGGSSRSTRSSASRDESEYKHSATTHTTRSSSGEDDITIKVSAGCVVEVGNVKIHSQDGGAVSIGRNGTSHGGSDRGTSIYGDDRLLRDDRRSRSDRSSTRMRANSQAAYARGLPAPGSYTPSPLYSRYDYDDDSSY